MYVDTCTPRPFRFHAEFLPILHYCRSGRLDMMIICWDVIAIAEDARPTTTPRYYSGSRATCAEYVGFLIGKQKYPSEIFPTRRSWRFRKRICWTSQGNQSDHRDTDTDVFQLSPANGRRTLLWIIYSTRSILFMDATNGGGGFWRLSPLNIIIAVPNYK